MGNVDLPTMAFQRAAGLPKSHAWQVLSAMGARGKLWNPSKSKEARLVVVSVFFLDIKHQIVNPMGIFKFLLI